MSAPRPLHAVLDARWIFEEISGIGRYTRELAAALVRTAGPHRLTLVFGSPALAGREQAWGGYAPGPGLDIRVWPEGPFSPRAQFGIGPRLRARDADVYHAPNFVLPYPAFPRRRRPGRCAAVATIHDLIPILFPHFTPRALKNRARPLVRAMMRETVRRSAAVIVPSECTRRDILRALDPGADARVHVVPEAASPRHTPGGAPPEPGVILFVGRRDPYKNLRGLIAAFARLAPGLPRARLRIVSAPDPRYPEAEAEVRRLGLEGRVEWAGYVATDALLDAYRAASVFVLPSLYEGFGLPVLEAMACGTPVICTDVSSLPEVAGDAAILVPPDDIGALAGALRRVLGDPEEAARLRRLGLARAALFSWDRAARETWAIYEQAAHS